MKLFITIAALLSITPALAATVKIDSKESLVNWEGRKLAGVHHGTLVLKDGAFIFKNKKLTGGEFSVDMTSLKDEDITDPEYNAKLVGHLKSDDFFSIEKHPTSTFKITDVKPGSAPDEYNITGDLSIKGISQRVTFPATITEEKGKTKASATLEVDRTKFNIKYRSASFFEGLGDKVIKDNFALKISLVAPAAK
jgi:polyisoprenoid-binding protein YceI